MNICLAEPVAYERSARRLECDLEEARWEAQLRRLSAAAKQQAAVVEAPRPLAIVAPSRLPGSPLELTAGLTPRDLLLLPRSLPAFSADDLQNLECGKCRSIIGARISRRTARRAHPEGDRLVVRCSCRALNLVSGGATRHH